MPSAPSLIGVAALAFAAVGAMASQPDAALAHDGVQKFAAAQASVLNAASSADAADVLSSRERAISRDADREALQEAAAAELEAEAEQLAEEHHHATAEITEEAEKRAAALAKRIWQFPLAPGTYHVSHNYGQCSSLWSNCHTGEDFSAPSGTPIHSVAAGVVTSAEYDGAYGNKTVVTLEDGTEIWYCHQTEMGVSVGDVVAAGDVIGTVGSTGNSTGSHLHLEIRPGGGEPVSPLAVLGEQGASY